MRRRLDLAISLIAMPPVLFLDEPTTGLDPRSRLAMWEIMFLVLFAAVFGGAISKALPHFHLALVRGHDC